MSRLGNKPIPVPGGVQVSVSDGVVEIKGPKGSLTQQIPRGITVEHDRNDAAIKVARQSDARAHRALHGLVYSLVKNMVVGVTDGFSKSLEIIGVGYGAKLQGKELVLSVGFTNPVKVPIPEGLTVAEPQSTSVAMPGIGSVPVTAITISGTDKQKVGQFAADVRAVRPPEPYKGKGIRYKGEEVRRKAGKAMAGTE